MIRKLFEMKRLILPPLVALALAAGGVQAIAQTAPTDQPSAAPPAASSGTGQYQPILPAESSDGSASQQGAAQTAPGAALQGMSQVISAEGQYNLATSAAALNMTQAQSNELRNEVQAVQTFWAMRDIGRIERQLERGPRPTAEEFARRARAAAPLPLTTGQVDPVDGTLHWPLILQNELFQPQRIALQELTAKWIKYGGLDYSDQAQIRAQIDDMFEILKAKMTSLPPQDYVACRAFLRSLLYSTTGRVL